MIPAVTFRELEEDVARRRLSAKALGLLFAPPGSKFVREHILPRLDDYHHDSGADVHFYCVGYSAYCPKDGEHYADNQPVAVRVNEHPWEYSARSFHAMRREIEARTTWTYQGEADLILLSTKEREAGSPSLDPASAFYFRLDELVADKTIDSVGGFFTWIFSEARKFPGGDFVAWLYKSPDLPVAHVVPHPIRKLWQRAKREWDALDYPGVVQACASALEAMAKHVIGRDDLDNKTLKSIGDAYRKASRLDDGRIDRVLEIYQLRSVTPRAGHGAMREPGLTRDQAHETLSFTAEAIGLEYEARVRYVGLPVGG